MPKSKEQFEQIKQERIKQIFHYALYLFALRGIDGVTTDEITRAAGCSHGLLYHYFGSKEELFQKVVTDVAKKLEEEIIINVDLSQKPCACRLSGPAHRIKARHDNSGRPGLRFFMAV